MDPLPLQPSDSIPATPGDIARFYELALRLQLVSVPTIIAWADALIMGCEGIAPPGLVELSLAANAPPDRVMVLLQEMSSTSPRPALLFLAALIANRVEIGAVTGYEAALMLYRLQGFDGYAIEVLGGEILYLDEQFDDYMPRGTGEAAVREFLQPFMSIRLPCPIS